MLLGIVIEEGEEHTHRSNTNQWCAHTSIQASSKSIPGYALPHNIDRAAVHAPLGGLQTDLHKVKRMSDDDGADTSETSSYQTPEPRKGLLLHILHISLELLLCFGQVGDFIG